MKITTIENFFQVHNQFRIATEADNQELLKFFNSSQMGDEKFSINYERGNNFFEFLIQSSDSYYVLVNATGPINFIGTLTVREGHINGEIKRIAYFGDLRSKLSAKQSVAWRNAYIELIKNIKNIRPINADLVLTAIMDNNRKAKKALLNKDLKYFLVTNYKMINILKFSSKKMKYQVSIEDQSEELINFFANKMKNKIAGFTIDFWNKFNGKHLVVRDNDKIIAYCCLWSPAPAKEIKITKIPKLLNSIIKLFSKFTLLPKVGENLKIMYLNFLIFHFQYSKKQILQDILSFLSQNSFFENYHFISYGDFDNNPINLNAIFKDSTKLNLYSVGREIKLGKNDDISFEISLV